MTVADRPNIVLVHGHDIGRHIGAYGRQVDTPALDQLSRSGLRFDRFFCPAPQCSPSRASLTTGRYPHRTGMLGLAHMGWNLNDPTGALPHRLRALGYETYLFGEQHEASTGEVLGYDHSVGTRWPQLARVVAPEFAAQAGSMPRPFFASVGFFEAHRPFDHAGYTDDDPNAVEVPPYLPDTAEVRADIAALNGRIRAVDEGVGVVVEALTKQGLREDTLLVFTTDHGLALPRAKGTLYDAGLEVAFIASWPGVVPRGTVSDKLLCNIDVAPTLLELAGGTPSAEIDGRSFAGLLGGGSAGVRDEFMCEMTYHDRYAPMRGIRTESWKYIRRFSEEPTMYLPADVADSPSGRAALLVRATAPALEELYDLTVDPQELDNLIDRPAHTERAAELRVRVDSWMEETDDPLLTGKP